jgi:hypothetical protein
LRRWWRRWTSSSNHLRAIAETSVLGCFANPRVLKRLLAGAIQGCLAVPYPQRVW